MHVEEKLLPLLQLHVVDRERALLTHARLREQGVQVLSAGAGI
jgi:hypothetical protein